MGMVEATIVGGGTVRSPTTKMVIKAVVVGKHSEKMEEKEKKGIG
jgi:hypothetical protein